MPILKYQDKYGTKILELGSKERIILGRGKECDVVLDDSMASRQHVELRKLPSGFILTDLNSKNGTLVNKCPVSTWTLKDNDQISIGNTVLTYKIEG
jgi:pSer/pThr/pTyr-binding forkhead associated (FHA) protein